MGKAVGFAREGGCLHVTGGFTIRDAAESVAIPSPVTFDLDEKAPDELKSVAFDFSLFANRPGEFVAALELRDAIDGKTATYELPLTVYPPRSISAAGAGR